MDSRNGTLVTIAVMVLLFIGVFILFSALHEKEQKMRIRECPVQVGEMVYIPGMNITGKVDQIFIEQGVTTNLTYHVDVIFFSRNGVISKANVNALNLQPVEKKDLQCPLGF